MGWGAADVPLSISCPARPQLTAPSLTRRSPQINDELNHQFEAVCESVFGEVESQAVEALDLPGCFRMRSHSYLRAIQAGCSQDDDCLSLFSMSAPAGPPITSSILKPSTCESRGLAGARPREGPPHLPACKPGHLPRAAAAPPSCPVQPPGTRREHPAQGTSIPLRARASRSGHEHPAPSSAPAQGTSILPAAQSRSGGRSVVPAPICLSLLPSTSVPISVPCWVLQRHGQRGSGVVSDPFLGINRPKSPSELQPGSQPVEVQTPRGCEPCAAGGGGQRSPGAPVRGGK